MASIQRIISVWLLLMALNGCQSTGEQTIGSRNDAAISYTVQMKLMKDHQSGFPNIEVDSDHGIVKLRGVVETEAQRARAEQLARQVVGIVEVDNSIRIKPQPSSSASLGNIQIEGSDSGQAGHQAPSPRTYGGLIIQGDVVRVEKGYYFVKEKDGKEVRLETDQTTKMGPIKKGDHIVATMDEEKHVLSMHSVP